jgi:hypothetical protein
MAGEGSLERALVRPIGAHENAGPEPAMDTAGGPPAGVGELEDLVLRDNRRANRSAIRLTRATAAVLGVVVLSMAAPATAAPSTVARADVTFDGQLSVDCVLAAENNTYRAVFGYNNYAGHDVTIPVGKDNKLIPANLNGAQTIQFAVGPHRASFSTAPMPVGVDITWTVGGLSVKATADSPACGPEVSLPAEGNGTAPIFVLAASLIALGVIAIRLRGRDRGRTRTA